MKSILRPLATLSFMTAAPLNAQWQVESESDAMTDKTNARAKVIGDGGALQLMCTEGKGWGLIFAPKGYLGRQEAGDIWFRIDQNPAQRMQWFYLTDYVALTNNDQINAVVTPLMNAKKITIRAKDYRSRNIDVVFDNSGFLQAFVDIARRCGVIPAKTGNKP